MTIFYSVNTQHFNNCISKLETRIQYVSATNNGGLMQVSYDCQSSWTYADFIFAVLEISTDFFSN